MNKRKKIVAVKSKNNSLKIINEIIFILLTLLGIVYFVALYTHVITEDPFTGGVSLSETVNNNAGIIGAWISDISFAILGHASYVVAISIVWLGYRFHKSASLDNTNKLIFIVRFIFYLFMICAITALLDQYISNKFNISGGWLGEFMHMNLFKDLLGSVSTLVYIGVIMICSTIVMRFSWLKFITYFSNKIKIKKLKRKEEKIIKNNLNKNLNKKPLIKDSKKPVVKNNNKIKHTIGKTNTDDVIPTIELLNGINNSEQGYSNDELESMSKQVEIKLKDFGFDVAITAVTPGPVVTQFELSLAPGVKVSKIMTLSKDLARALLVESVRIVDVIPGKPVIGLEIPNNQRSIISLKEILSSDVFIKSKSILSIGLGKDINGRAIVADLLKMPHLLLAGATGMGKSVGLNAIILSILYKAKPEQVRMIMIDPKIVELACYDDIPHLLTPVVTDMNEAASALWWCVSEMERRYNLLAKFSVRNIESFNSKLIIAKKSGKPWLDPTFDTNNLAKDETAPELEELPLIVIIIDEYADMLGALAQEDRNKSKRVEGLIVRIAQKARAAGIHLIIATQRPSVDVITGLIKSNVPTRISFKVSSKTDSRTVLDQSGAEQLLGMGDMLYMTPGASFLKRIHGVFVDDNEINNVVNYIKENSQVDYVSSVIDTQQDAKILKTENQKKADELDPLYDEAVKIVTSTRRASISSIQRRMRIGYNRAARIIEDMEASGVVSPINSAGSREVLAPEPIDE